MTAELTQRCTMALLFSLALATLVGLVALGPVTLQPEAHLFADERALGWLPNASNVLTHLPLFVVGWWGWRRVRQLDAPADLKRPWTWFFLAAIPAGLMGSVYHWAPDDMRFVLSQIPRSYASVLLLCVFLAERVDRRWGSHPVLLGWLAAMLLGGLWWAGTHELTGAGDLRPLLWIGLSPLLLVPAGIWRLPGSRISGANWLVVLVLFAMAHALQWADAAVMRALDGVASGHALHHIALAGCIGWLAYCADAPVPTASASPFAEPDAGATALSAQRSTSLNTSS
jgi:hypothetical protein